MGIQGMYLQPGAEGVYGGCVREVHVHGNCIREVCVLDFKKAMCKCV